MARLKKININPGSSIPLQDVMVSDGLLTDSVINGDFTNVDLDSALNGSNSKIDSTPLADRVRNSESYKIAYNLFYPYRSSNPEWLAQLESVPTMVDDSDPTWFDKHGWSNNFDDKQDSAYQFCMEYIAELVSSFHQWRNSLPATQANQFAQVGYNSAITGEGLDGSAVGDLDRPSAQPSAMPSTNPLDYVDRVGSLFTNFNSGILGYLTSLNNINIAKRQLDLEGLKFAFEKDKISGEQLLNWLGVSKQFNDSGYTDVDLPTPNVIGSSADKYKASLGDSEKTYGLGFKTQKEVADSFTEWQLHPANNIPAQDYSSALSEWSKYRFETWKLEQQYERAKVQYEQALYSGLDPHIQAQHQNAMFKLERQMFDYKYKYINALYEKQLEPENYTAQYIFNYIMSSGYDIGMSVYREEMSDIARGKAISDTALGGLGIVVDGLKKK